MTKIICKRCLGQGWILGGGMMHVDCDDCDGIGKIYPKDEPKEVKKVEIDRRSANYKQAIGKIKDLHPDKSIEECKEIFEQEYNKIA